MSAVDVPHPAHASRGRRRHRRAHRRRPARRRRRARLRLAPGRRRDRRRPRTSWRWPSCPGFLAPTVAGHGGTIRSVPVGERRALVLLGRTHLYEGHGVGAGGARGAHRRRGRLPHGGADQRRRRDPGGHAGRRPGADLRPPQPDRHARRWSAPRFTDLTDLYSPRLRALAREIDPSLTEGVYAGLPGPHFETPAEIRMLRGAGRRPGRHVHRAGGDRGPRRGRRGVRAVAGHQPGRRDDRRAAGPPRGARRRAGRGRADGRAAARPGRPRA